MSVTLERKTMETKFKKHIIIDILRIEFRYSVYLFSIYQFVM